MTSSQQELIYQEKQNRFSQFVSELELLTKKYGVEIDCCGGVFVMNKEDIPNIKTVSCSNDYSSGDLSTTVEYI